MSKIYVRSNENVMEGHKFFFLNFLGLRKVLLFYFILFIYLFILGIKIELGPNSSIQMSVFVKTYLRTLI
jgi:hypothetical protein